MAIVAVGDFNADSVERMIRARFETIARGGATARARADAPVPDHTETLVAITTDIETSQSDVSVLWKQALRPTRTVADYQRDLAVSLFLSMINQRFDEIVRKPDAPFIQAGASQGRLVRTGEAFSLDATVKDGDIERGLTATFTEAERVRQHGFTTTELDRQKTALLRSLEIQLNERDKTSSGTFALRYVNHFLTDDPQIGIEVRAPLIRALLPGITLAQVNAIAREWLVDRNRVILASAPPAKPGAPMPTSAALQGVFARVRATRIAAYVDAEAGAAIVATPPTPGRIVAERRIEGIDVLEWKLSNGARVLVKATDFQADQVYVGGISLGGVGNKPPSQFFSGQIGPQLLERGGVGTLDAIALRNTLTGKAVNAAASIDQRTESVSGSGSPGDIETLFQLIWARVRTPRVDTAAVSAFKQQFAAFFRNRSNQPQTVYFDTIGVTLSQNHPLARPISSGLIDSLDVRLGLEVFNDRFKDFSDFTFVIVGAIQPDAMRPLVERWIASLPGGGRVETGSEVDIPPPTGSVQKVVRKGIEPQAQSHIFLTGKTTWSRDAAMAANAISEIVTIRLRDLLREDLGGTYGSGFSTAIERSNGRFQTVVNFGSAPERADSLSNVALGVLRKFAAEGPTADELAKVKENFLRSRETELRQNGFWAGLLQDASLWNDDPEERHRTFNARVAAINAEQVRAVAQIVLSEANIARFRLLPESPKP
jgi:zinc protease